MLSWASGGTVSSVSGTSPISVATGTSTPVISLENQSANLVLAGPATGAAAAPTFRSLVLADLPTSSITSLANLTATGTITSGTWSGSFGSVSGANLTSLTAANLSGTVAATSGGTGQTTYATGELLYASAANTLSKLAPTTNGYVLTLASGAPTWAAAAGGGLLSDGASNTKAGTQALEVLVYGSGMSNTAMGWWAMRYTTEGINNVAFGDRSLQTNTIGNGNTAVGHGALQNATGSTNTGLGYPGGDALTTGDWNIAIGNSGVAAESNTIRIGTTYASPSGQNRAFIAGISGVTSTGGAAVFINSSGQLGTLTSSRRFKENILPMGDLSSRIFGLRPVTFTYKAEYGGGGQQYGLIAEEVDEVIPEMTVRDKDGQIETVAYQLLPPMLLNEAQKQHKAIEALQAENQTLKAEVATLKAQMAAVLARLSQ